MSVYFLQGKDGGPVKIGFSHNPERRQINLQMASPNELVPIRTVDGGATVEAWFHKRFKEHRIRGEWFDFVDEMMVVDAPAVLVAEDTRKATQVSFDYEGRDFERQIKDLSRELMIPDEIAARDALQLRAGMARDQARHWAKQALTRGEKAADGGNRPLVNLMITLCKRFLSIEAQWHQEYRRHGGGSEEADSGSAARLAPDPGAQAGGESGANGPARWVGPASREPDRDGEAAPGGGKALAHPLQHQVKP